MPTRSVPPVTGVAGDLISVAGDAPIAARLGAAGKQGGHRRRRTSSDEQLAARDAPAENGLTTIPVIHVSPVRFRRQRLGDGRRGAA